MSKRYFYFMLIVLLAPKIATAGPSLIFTEVLFNAPTPESDEEWVEIFNAGGSAISIGGYTIEDNSGTYTIASATIINPGQTMVFARDATAFNNRYGFSPDFGDFTRGLANGGDELSLKDTGGKLIDFVAWEDFVATWDLTADDNESIKRKAFPISPDSWLSNQTPDPGSPAPIPEPGTVLLMTFGLITIGILRGNWKRLGD